MEVRQLWQVWLIECRGKNLVGFAEAVMLAARERDFEEPWQYHVANVYERMRIIARNMNDLEQRLELGTASAQL
jgi:hypothetical protein